MEAEDFSLAVEEAANGTVVWVTGELDMDTSAQLGECLKNLDGGPVTVDFSAVTFMDSSGIAAIARAMKHAARHRSTFALRSVQPNQRRLLEIAGLAEQLDLDE
jgi:anti-anti-sigma factor